jgi:hypothetical protein
MLRRRQRYSREKPGILRRVFLPKTGPVGRVAALDRPQNLNCKIGVSGYGVRNLGQQQARRIEARRVKTGTGFIACDESLTRKGRARHCPKLDTKG